MLDRSILNLLRLINLDRRKYLLLLRRTLYTALIHGLMLLLHFLRLLLLSGFLLLPILLDPCSPLDAGLLLATALVLQGGYALYLL